MKTKFYFAAIFLSCLMSVTDAFAYSHSRSSSSSISSSNRFSSNSTKPHVKPSSAKSASVAKTTPVVSSSTPAPKRQPKKLDSLPKTNYSTRPITQAKTIVVNNHYNDTKYRSSGSDLLSTAIIAGAAASIANSANANQNVQQNISTQPIVKFNFIKDCSQWVCN